MAEYWLISDFTWNYRNLRLLFLNYFFFLSDCLCEMIVFGDNRCGFGTGAIWQLCKSIKFTYEKWAVLSKLTIDLIKKRF